MARPVREITLSLTPAQHAALGYDYGEIAEEIQTVLRGIAALRTTPDPRAPWSDVRRHGEDWAEDVLRDTEALIVRLEGVRAAALRIHAASGASVGRSGIMMGTSRATAQTRRDALRRAPEPAELWASGQHGATDHPGARVPESLRSWSVPWHAYLPVDITPPELLPAGLADSVAEGWAEPYQTPYDVPDMLRCSLDAVIPYDIDHRHWPLNPQGRTGRVGRNLGKWGEVAAADMIATAGEGPERLILLIKRSDRGVWAIPGGKVDPGESALDAMVREAREETGIVIDPAAVRVGPPRVVDDWRNTDHSWIVTTPGYVHLERAAELTPGDVDDDGAAADAQWWPYPDLAGLESALAEAGQSLYDAHRPMLAELADTLGRQDTTMDDLDRRPGETSAEYARRTAASREQGQRWARESARRRLAGGTPI